MNSLHIKASAAIAFIAATNIAAAQKNDPIVNYISSARTTYSVCARAVYRNLAATESRKNTQYEAYIDVDRANWCRSKFGPEVIEALKAAQKSAKKNSSTAALLENFHRRWLTLLTTELAPSGNEAAETYSKRNQEINKELQKSGSEIILSLCKNDFACINEKIQPLGRIDAFMHVAD
jgi:hypothetical protein